MKKFIVILAILLVALSSCSEKRATIFKVGQTREYVINTIANDFIIDGQSMTKEMVLDAESGNHITLYECDYKGQYYRKVRVYYINEKVRKIEIKTPKDKYPNLLSDLEDEYGMPHKTMLKKYLIKEDAVVFMGEESAVIVFETDGEYELLLVSGEDKEKLNSQM